MNLRSRSASDDALTGMPLDPASQSRVESQMARREPALIAAVSSS